MRIPSVLHFVAGVGVVVILAGCLAGVEGKKVEEKKNELSQQETNSIKTPSLFTLFRRLLPEKTLETLRAAAASTRSQTKAKSLKLDDAKIRSMKSKKKLLKDAKSTVAPTTSPVKKLKQVPNRFRTSVKPITTSTSKVKVTPKVKKITKKTTIQPTQVRKQKTGKELRSRQNSKTRFPAFDATVASPSETQDPEERHHKEAMQVLTHDQKRNRLRQELVRETEDNCLAKILCGTGSKPKPKEKNTLVSDTAYLIKEFFNIFDFTIDDVREEIQEIDDVNKKAYEAEEKEKKKQKQREEEEEEEEEDEEEDDADDEEDEIFRKTPVSEVPKKKKYTTRIPTNKDVPKPKTSQQTEVVPEQKIMEPVVAQPKTRRPKPVSSLEMTTVGDIAPIAPTKRPTSTVSTMNRLGEVVTPSTINLLTSTIMSTSMSGSATLKPVDMPFSIPLKTAKDDADDEEDDNQKYQDDNDEDGSTFHRVTLEELVGDIQLSPSDFEMIRRGRSMRHRQPRMKISLKNVTNDKYIQSKLRQMKLVKNEVKKLQIAQKVARSMRQPRQCRQFNQVAQEVLQTCPLTTEVIRFFNTNLKNGTSIEVKKIPPGGLKEGGGLVLLNNDPSGSQQAYFVDNSPQIANTKIQADLKNPSLPGSHNPEEDQYAVYERRPNPNPQNANLNQFGYDVTRPPPPTTTPSPPPQKKQSNKDESDEEQDDEGSDEEGDDIGELRRDDEEESDGSFEEEEEDEEDQENDDVESREEENDDEDYDDDADDDEEEGSEDDSSQDKKPVVQKVVLKIKQKNDHHKIQGSETNQPNIKLAVRPKPPKKPVPPTTTLPPGIIRVYGVPQTSFDRDFTQLAPIGQPVNLFGDEFLDSPPYKRRRQLGKYGHRTSKRAKNEDDEAEAAENVAYNARIPKHPPLEAEPYSHDGDDDDDDGDNKQAFKNPKKKHQESNGGKPLGGVKGTEGDDDDDDDDKKVTSSEKKDNDDKDNSAEDPPVKIHSIDEPPFVPSVMYNVAINQPQANPHEYYGGGGSPSSQYGYGSQVVQYHNQYQNYQNVPVRRPHAFRPIVRPIKIIPDVAQSYYMRPGRLYQMYGNHGK